MKNRPDPKVVDSACYEALSSIGISRKYGMGNLVIQENFMVWIGLNQGVHPTFVRVNANIGIHSIPLMKLVADAAGKKYRRGASPTLCYPLGTVLPNYRQFIFATEADILPESKRLAESILLYGIPFIRSLASYLEMLPRLNKEVKNLGGMPERYAAGLYLSGDIEGAFNFLDEQAAIFVNKNFLDEVETLKQLKSYIKAVAQ